MFGGLGFVPVELFEGAEDEFAFEAVGALDRRGVVGRGRWLFGLDFFSDKDDNLFKEFIVQDTSYT